MPDYRITFARSARKELELLDASEVAKIYSRIISLVKDPRPHGCIKLKGPENLWRIRCGVYRVIYAIDDDHCIIDVVRIRHRKDAYE